MASSEQVRNWYPEVVTNHSERCKPGYEPQCDTSQAIRLGFPKEGGGVYNLWIHPKTKEAWEAYVQAMEVHGETVPGAGGTHNCRNIGVTDCPSLHAYCVALDLPPNNRKSEAFQVAVLGMKTNTGVKVFKNLTSINDRMHDQIDASPQALASGIDWSTVPSPEPVPSPPGDNDMDFWIKILKRQQGPWWVKLKALTGVPAGDALYWSPEGSPTAGKASEAEWQAQAETLSAAALRAGVEFAGTAGPPGPSPKSATFTY